MHNNLLWVNIHWRRPILFYFSLCPSIAGRVLLLKSSISFCPLMSLSIRLPYMKPFLCDAVHLIVGHFASIPNDGVKDSVFSDRLVGLVVKASALESGRSRVRIPLETGFFSGSSHTSDLKIGTPMATLPGTWRYRVSTGTGRPGVSILWLGDVESRICNICLSVAARTIVWAYPSLRYTSLLLGRKATNQPTNKQTNCLFAWD